MADLLRRLVPKELVMPIAKAVGGHPKRLLRQAAPEMAETLIRTLKDFRIPVSDYRPFEEAIVTAGGITVSEVNPATMESRLYGDCISQGKCSTSTPTPAVTTSR